MGEGKCINYRLYRIEFLFIWINMLMLSGYCVFLAVTEKKLLQNITNEEE